MKLVTKILIQVILSYTMQLEAPWNGLQCVYFKNKTISQNTLNEKETRHVTKLVFSHVMSEEFSYVKMRKTDTKKHFLFMFVNENRERIM